MKKVKTSCFATWILSVSCFESGVNPPRSRSSRIFVIFALLSRVTECRHTYRISPNFRGAQFFRIPVSKHRAETIFADQEFQEFRVYGILKLRWLNFCVLQGIRENSENYAPKICTYTIWLFINNWEISRVTCAPLNQPDHLKTGGYGHMLWKGYIPHPTVNQPMIKSWQNVSDGGGNRETDKVK